VLDSHDSHAWIQTAHNAANDLPFAQRVRFGSWRQITLRSVRGPLGWRATDAQRANRYAIVSKDRCHRLARHLRSARRFCPDTWEN
jgi:hypothetical protein